VNSLLRFIILILICLPAGAEASPAHAKPAWPSSHEDVTAGDQYAVFPLPLNEYADKKADAPRLPLPEKIKARAEAQPFNLAATIIFICAILHTFLAGIFQSWSHKVEERHREKLKATGRTPDKSPYHEAGEIISFKAKLLHFLGEVEAVFALWAIPLLLSAWYFYGWGNVERFVGLDCNFTEPFFVVVIMTISASRPVVRFAEQCLSVVATRLGGGPAAWWISVLTLAPLLGSLITEPAAMTISAMLLARKFYELKPGKVFAYATLGLLFVNISVGGVLTNFAAPPVLMVAAKWNWSSWFMLTHFGGHAVMSIIVCNALYFAVFRGQFKKLADPDDRTREGEQALIHWHDRDESVPRWITLTHLAFLGWTVFTAHYPPLFIGGFLFFLAFVHSTEHHQNPVAIRAPLLVGFFLAGLVIHGRCQAWWLEPLLSSNPPDWQLMLGATVLTGFNDNALITFLASQVPLEHSLKYAVMAGAVAGGGLTVIANAPNPAGQGILKSYFGGTVNPLGLLLAALIPTAIVMCAFLFLSPG
jgi:Na+/H+ antiporter NhaD/arsenite permease-like protein